jgi:hypothetical protein
LTAGLDETRPAVVVLELDPQRADVAIHDVAPCHEVRASHGIQDLVDWGAPERVIQPLAEAGLAAPWAQGHGWRTLVEPVSTGRRLPVASSSAGHQRA